MTKEYKNQLCVFKSEKTEMEKDADAYATKVTDLVAKLTAMRAKKKNKKVQKKVEKKVKKFVELDLTHEEIALRTEEFLSNGGEIEVLPSKEYLKSENYVQFKEDPTDYFYNEEENFRRYLHKSHRLTPANHYRYVTEILPVWEREYEEYRSSLKRGDSRPSGDGTINPEELNQEMKNESLYRLS